MSSPINYLHKSAGLIHRSIHIHIITDNYKQVYTPEFYLQEEEYRKKMSLSREFCHFMGRRHVISRPLAELDQICKLVNVDVAPIYQMDEYWDEETVKEYLIDMETEEAKENFLEKVKESNKKIEGNIDLVTETITSLIGRLSEVDNLEKMIIQHDRNTYWNHDFYFSNFNDDKGEGYIGNNFGQDLRNFKWFLEYAKAKGAQTVFFHYG